MKPHATGLAPARRSSAEERSGNGAVGGMKQAEAIGPAQPHAAARTGESTILLLAAGAPSPILGQAGGEDHGSLRPSCRRRAPARGSNRSVRQTAVQGKVDRLRNQMRHPDRPFVPPWIPRHDWV